MNKIIKPKGLIVTKEKLAALLGISQQTITAWHREGMPVHRHGFLRRTIKYDTAAVLNWRVNQLVNEQLK